jgi:hypothetical protein
MEIGKKKEKDRIARRKEIVYKTRKNPCQFGFV